MAYLSLTTVGSSCHWSVYSSSAKAEMYFQNLGIYDFFKTSANLSYDQKCWHFSDHTNVVLTCSFVQRQRYCVNKLHLLATSLVANYWSGTATQSTKSLWHLAAGLLNYSIYLYYSIVCTTAYHIRPHGNSASLQHWVCLWKVLRGVLSSYTTQMSQIETAVSFLTSWSKWTCPHTISHI